MRREELWGAACQDKALSGNQGSLPEELGEALEQAGFLPGRVIGQGAFSEVFEVRAKEDGRLYACKVTVKNKASEREARLLAELAHPLFPRFCRSISGTERDVLVMERVYGDSLEEHLGRRVNFRPGDAVRIALELAEGLHYLHSRPEPVFYRDLKPSNILVQPDGSVRLVDLGSACSESESREARAGTPGYSAPEQFRRNVSVTAASDVYSLGRVLLQLLTGVDPYHPVPASVTSYLERCGYGGLMELAERCTEPEPGKRIADMQALLELLIPYSDEGGETVREAVARLWKARRRPEYIACKNIWKSAPGYRDTAG